MSVAFRIIIPARYASTRLPGKPLLDIKGKPLLQHVYESSLLSDAESVVIATDDERIGEVAEAFGAQVVMTAVTHASGTDRIAEAARQLELGSDEIVVNVQGDEFGLPVTLVNQLAENLHEDHSMQMATLCAPITDRDDYLDPNIVKVVMAADQSALYFSRSPIPADRNGALPGDVFRHIGLYAYRAGYLQTYTRLSPCPLEQSESLEQLRVLYHGGRIHVDIAREKTGTGIDTAADLSHARK